MGPTGMQTPKQIVTERASWANSLEIADRNRMRKEVGPALVDQMDAAHHESIAALNDLSHLIRGELVQGRQPSHESLRALASLIQYAYDRASYVCEHAHPSRSPRPITALMAADVVACDECRYPITLQIGDQHPGACEFCGRPTKTFFPNAFSYAHVTLLADVCKSCTAELHELLDGD